MSSAALIVLFSLCTLLRLSHQCTHASCYYGNAYCTIHAYLGSLCSSSCYHVCNTTAAAEEEAQVVEVIQQRAAAARTAAAQQAKLMVHMAAKKRATEAANADSGLIILRARYGLDLHIDYGERSVSCTLLLDVMLYPHANQPLALLVQLLVHYV
jgi:Domain of unknown function (DUF3395)